jgi:putative ABC transport system permease protein
MLGDTLGRLGAYLGLIGVFALLLGGIGVASAMGAYMRRKADTVAVLRCLGATAPQVFTIYLLQAAALGLAGAAIGAGIGVAAQWALPRLFAGLLPVEAKLALHPAVIAAGIGVGVWVALVFALLPLLGTRRVSPLGALRRRTDAPPRAGRDAWSAAAWVALAASALLLAVWQAGNAKVGAAFVLGIAAALALLWLAAWLVMRLLRRSSPRALPYVVRQGVANLYRPGNQTRAVVLALGFGVFLLATLLLVQHNLLRPLQVGGGEARANLLLWDVQPDQEPALDALLAGHGAAVVQSAPIVPMRIAALNGTDVQTLAPEPEGASTDEETPEPEGGRRARRGREAGRPAAWALRREYRSTYRDSLVGSERVVAGRWETGEGTGDREQGTGEIVYPLSLEVGVAEDLGVGVGDRIDWDVQGVRVATEVTSLREVDWARFEPNFFAVFPPAALEAAPHSFVVLSRAGGESERAGLQRTVVERFPNVAVLDLTQLQHTLDTVIGRVSAVIRFLAAFSVATGFVVLLGAVAAGRLERIHDSVLLRALGATRRQVAAILAVEYLLLGALAALVGAGLAVGAGWALARWLFDVGYGVPAPPLLSLGGAVALLAVMIGMWASREVYAHTPLEVLREE